MSERVRLAVVFYSTYGTNHRMAEVAAEAARSTGAQVRLRKCRETAPDYVVATQDAWRSQAERMAAVAEATPDDLVWANAFLFSTPTRCGVAASQVRAFIDTLGPVWQQGELADKAASAMASAQNVHGGQETTVLGMHATFMHWGAVVVAPGYTHPIQFTAGGNPYGVSVTASGEAIPHEVEEAIRHQTRRLIDVAARLAA